MNVPELATTNQPFSLENHVDIALTQQDSLKVKLLLALGTKYKEIKKIGEKALKNHPNQRDGINKTLDEVHSWYKSRDVKANLKSTILFEVFQQTDPSKAEENLNLFLSAGGSFHDIQSCLNQNKLPTDLKEFTYYLEILRRTIKIEQQFLQNFQIKVKKSGIFGKKIENPYSQVDANKTSQYFDQLLSDYHSELLHMACQEGLKDLAVVIMQEGGDVNVTSKMGATPLHTAANKGDIDIMTMLIKKNAKINPETFTGKETPLHMAVSQRQLAAVQLLISHGADVNCVSAQGKTPLHNAIHIGDEAIVRSLLENRADPNAPNKEGLTPLHFAFLVENLSLIQLLLEHGADPSLIDHKGESPFQSVVSLNFSKLLKDIIKNFPKIQNLLSNPENLLSSLLQNPQLLLVNTQDISKNNPLEIVMMIGNRDLAAKIAALMSPEQFQFALEELEKKYPAASFKFITDNHFQLEKSFAWRVSQPEEIPPVAPLELDKFRSLFEGAEFKFSSKLVDNPFEESALDETGNLWKHPRMATEPTELMIPQNEFKTITLKDIQEGPNGEIRIGDITAPYVIMTYGKYHIPLKIRIENGFKKVDINVAMLLPLYEMINFSNPDKPGYRDPKDIHDSTDETGTVRTTVPLRDLEIGIKQFVNLIRFRIHFAAIPFEDEPEELEKWYAHLEKMVLPVIKMGIEEDIQAINDLKKIEKKYQNNPSKKNLKKKNQAEKMLTPSGSSVITYGISGLHCGTEFLDDTKFLYEAKIYVPKPFEEQVNHFFYKYKKGIIQSLVNKNNNQNTHEASKIEKVIDESAGIPDEEERERYYFQDPYLPSVNVSRIENHFWKEFTVTKLIDLLQSAFNGKTEFNEDLVFRQFKDKTPLNWEKEKYDKIYQELKDAKTTEEKISVLEQNEIIINTQDKKEPNKIQWEQLIEEDRKASFIGKFVFDRNGKYKREAIAFLLRDFGAIQKG